MRRYMLIVLVLAMLLSVFSMAVYAGDETEISHEAYINGHSSGNFMPDNTMSRGEMAQMIYNLMKNDLPEGEAKFEDVKDTDWYAPAINALAAAEILNGYSDGTARPEKPVNRAELVKILANISQEEIAAEDCPFTDVPENHWAYSVICLAQEKGWVNGYPDGGFRPNATIKRAEAVAILNRFLGRIPDRKAIEANPFARVFPDVSWNKWYYWDVMEAAVAHTAVCQEGNEIWEDIQYYPAKLSDGFHVIQGKLILVKDQQVVRQVGSGTYNGVEYFCKDTTGICTVNQTLLKLADGRICVLKNGELWLNKGYYEYKNALYYCNGNGFLLQNGKVGSMYFGSDGKYTSGNKQIDEFVDSVLAQVTTPDMSKLEKLRKCYRYVFDHISYLGNNNHVPRGADPSTWTEGYMVKLIAIGRGNCFSYAAEMYYFARRIGYGQAEAISGRFGAYRSDHGWLEIVIDGVPYLFDPEVNWKYDKSHPEAYFMKRYGDVRVYYGR